MKRPLIPFLTALLAVSLSLNVWQFLRPAAAPEVTTIAKVVRAPAEKAFAGTSPLSSTGAKEENDEDLDAPAADEPSIAAQQKDPAKISEEGLLYGTAEVGSSAKPNGDVATRVTPERLKELAKQEPSKAAKFRVHAVLHLPGDRTLDLGISDAAPGETMNFEHIKEFPYPTSIKFADLTPQVAGKNVSSFPATPTTPGDFEFRNTGVTIEVDVTPAAGSLVLGGQVTHRTIEGLGRMPGEPFSPIYTTGVSESGKPEDVLLTENKLLQPQFSVAETPFLAAAVAGQPCRVPVRMAFGQTMLELTCTPLD